MSVHDSDKTGRDCDAKADGKGDHEGCCHHQHGTLDAKINDSHDPESEPCDGSYLLRTHAVLANLICFFRCAL